MKTKEIIERIFKDPSTKHELTEFDNLSKPIHEIIAIYPKTVESGREAGKTKYFMKSLVPFASGKEEIHVYSEGGKSNPEEIVRQLWVYKLINVYEYKPEEIELEKSVHFGTEINAKAADIVVYTDATKQTPKIILEVKKPKRKDGIEQLKSYLNAEGSPVGLWSNGSDRIILYRPYPKDFDDTLSDIPRHGQNPKDVLEAKKTIGHLKANRNFNFKKIIQDLEELVLADSGADEFNEIFKLIFAKIWDEKEASENRKDQVVEFRKSTDPEITYDRINKLFHRPTEEWQGIFDENENIKLRKDHLNVCVGPMEPVLLMGSNLRIMDDAFEYLLPTEAKKKKGQFFTPRHVVEMCVRMLNPKRNEYVMDPACGSGGFLLHAMDWCYPAENNEDRELRKHRYASKYLWGIDFETRASKTSRALMLIAGDGHSNIFGPDVSSLDPKTWYSTSSGQKLMQSLKDAKLLKEKISAADESNLLKDEDLAWRYFDELKFDVILANPPFAGEMRERKMLSHYDLAKPALKRSKDKQPKEERDVLFIERILKFLKPGGRAAIVLPQGKFNNSSLAFIREWILRKARLLAVVGLHGNTFKPHTGTKTSVLFVQKYTDEQLKNIEKIKQTVASNCPDYETIIKELISNSQKSQSTENIEQKDLYANDDISEDKIPEAVLEIMQENFNVDKSDSDSETESDSQDKNREKDLSEEPENSDDDSETLDNQDKIDAAYETISSLKNSLIKAKHKLINLESDLEALALKRDQELDVAEKSQKKEIRDKYKEELKQLKESQKLKKKNLNSEIKSLEKAIPEAEYELKLLTNRGRLEIVLQDSDLIGALKNRWIDAEIAKRLDYPIFMAVSERGGKNNSGDYEYMHDKNGDLVEFPEKHPQEGQPVINQDLVNYNLTAKELENAAEIPDDQLCIAEAFVRFAQKNNFDFWRVEH